MDQSNDTGGSSVHGQFILDVDLSGCLSAAHAEDLGQQLANALARALTEFLKEAPDFDLAVKGQVLCGWRVWGRDETPPLPSYSLRLPGVQTHGGYALTPVGIRWHDWSREGDDGG